MEIRRKDDPAAGSLLHRSPGYAFRNLPHHEPLRGNVKPSKLRYDIVNYRFTRERQGALLDDFEGSVSRVVLHGNNDMSGTGDEIHCASHALHHFSGNRPVRKVAVAGDLHRAQNTYVHMPAANHRKGLIAREETRTGQRGHGLFASVDQVGIFPVGRRRRPDPEQAILRLEDDVRSGRHESRNHGWKADSEIDIGAVF